MEIIGQNPYRILGVFSNASLREITAGKTKLSRFASVGKEIATPADLNGILPKLCRTSSLIEKAEASLSLPEDRLRHALFWFCKAETNDTDALTLLNEGKTEQAYDLWATRDSWSAHLNLGVLAFCRNDHAKGIRNITQVIHDPAERSAFINAVCGDTSQTDEESLAKTFIQAIQDTLPAQKLLNIFKANASSERYAQFLKEGVVRDPIGQINSEIRRAEEASGNAATICEAGFTLLENARPLLTELKLVMNEVDMEYRILLDKCAMQIRTCAVHSHNLLQEELSNGCESEYFKIWTKKIHALISSINTDNLSSDVKLKIEDDVKQLGEFVDHIDQILLQSRNLCWYCETREANSADAYDHIMHKVLSRSYNRVSYNKLTVHVPRCPECHKFHVKWESFGILAILGTTIITALVFALLTNNAMEEVLFGAFAGFAVSSLLYIIIRFIYKTKNKNKPGYIKFKKDIDDFPTIKQLRNDGWENGLPSA